MMHGHDHVAQRFVEALDFTASHFRPLVRMWMKFYGNHDDEANDKAAPDTSMPSWN